MSSEMTPFDAYQVRMERRLGEMRQAIDVELNRLHGEAVKVNAQHNSRSIFQQLAAVQACVEEATEEALTEGKALVDEARRQRKNALDLWREATADKARLVLHAHAEALYALNWCIAPELLPGVTPAITDSYKNALAHADCAVEDFTNGVWRPKPRPAIGATIITHNIHIGGNMAGGVIQQAGDQVRQEAGATSSDTAKTFNVNAHTAIDPGVNAKTYVARASNNPVANAVFLAGQALAHPGRSLFFEEATPDDDGNMPVLHVTVRNEPASALGVITKHKPSAPVLTPVFNWLLVFVCLFVVAAFAVDVYAGLLFKGPETDATKSLLSVTDWIVKGGLGAIIGLIGGKVAK